jgi:uncharacterized protein
LRPIVEPVESDVELMILTERHHGPGGGEHELREEEMGVYHLEGEILETAPILIEQLQLNLPMKPLCSPDCQGLCPVCGADRNAGACSCRESTVDPRWAGLAALKSRFGEDK